MQTNHHKNPSNWVQVFLRHKIIYKLRYIFAVACFAFPVVRETVKNVPHSTNFLSIRAKLMTYIHIIVFNRFVPFLKAVDPRNSFFAVNQESLINILGADGKDFKKVSQHVCSRKLNTSIAKQTIAPATPNKKQIRTSVDLVRYCWNRENLNQRSRPDRKIVIKFSC